MLAQPDFTDVLEARNFVGPIGYHSDQYINEVTLASQGGQPQSGPRT